MYAICNTHPGIHQEGNTNKYVSDYFQLRLGVLSVKGVLSVIVRTVNSTPAFSLVLWILRSKAVSGEFTFY